MARNRGRRGGTDEVGEADDVAPRPEDSIIVVDSDGAPIDLNEGDLGVVGVAAGEPAADDPKAEPPADDAFKVLERNFEALKAADAEKAARLAELEDERKVTHEDTRKTQRALLVGGLESAETAVISAKRAYADAMAAGDYEKASDAQELIAEASAERREFKQALEGFDNAPPEVDERRPRSGSRGQQQPAQLSHDQAVDAFISSLSPETQAFAKKHRDVIFSEESPRLNEVMAIHQLAVTRGIKPDTPAYFTFIEKQMDIAEGSPDPQPTARPKATPAKSKRPAMPAAPVNGGAPRGAVQVQLSREELAMASKLKMTPARYALHKKTAHDRANDPNYNGPRYSKDDPALRGAR